jgi:putative two-component system hydrogenase maturation factor HypX/HoxX
VPLHRDGGEWDELQYTESGGPQASVGWLDFDFHNGAMSERQCRRLVQALDYARGRHTRVLVLAGGADFFSNGIHLHDIEAAAQRAGDSAADASMRAIEAIDDVALAILQLTDRSPWPRCVATPVPVAASWRWRPTACGRTKACC